MDKRSSSHTCKLLCLALLHHKCFQHECCVPPQSRHLPFAIYDNSNGTHVAERETLQSKTRGLRTPPRQKVSKSTSSLGIQSQLSNYFWGSEMADLWWGGSCDEGASLWAYTLGGEASGNTEVWDCGERELGLGREDNPVCRVYPITVRTKWIYGSQWWASK